MPFVKKIQEYIYFNVKQLVLWCEFLHFENLLTQNVLESSLC